MSPSRSRKCNFCGIKKPLDEFDLSKSNSRQCNTCKSERRNDRISSNPLNYIQNLYVQLRYVRKKQGIPWEITPQQLYKLYAEQEGKCALTGQELTFKRSSEEEYDFNISIDRIDPTVGYYIENIQLIAKSVNFLKHDLPQEKFIKLIKLIYNNTNG